MVKQRKAFIWDLDGTLLDSYGIIVSSLRKTYQEYGIPVDEEDVYRHVIRYSVNSFIRNMEEKTGVPFAVMKDRYSELTAEQIDNIPAMPHAREILEWLSERGVENYVFTHRGTSTERVLKNLGLYDFFLEIITSQEGFPRKPEPDALRYLLEKYGLDRETTFYIGDRTLDMECAKNAGVHGVLLLPPKGYGEPSGFEEYIITDLMDVASLQRFPCPV